MLPFISRLFVLTVLLCVGAAPLFAQSDRTRSGYRLLDDFTTDYSAPSLLALVDEFLISRGADEDLVRVSISRSQRNADQVYLRMETGGYGDDSILGEKFIAIVVFRDNLFHITRAGVQPICARGRAVGGLCP